MTLPRAIVFDLDGTLVHSAPDLQAAMNIALEQVGRDALDLQTVISFIGNGVEKLVERSLHRTGGGDPEVFAKTLDAFHAAYAKNKTALTRLYPGVLDVLCGCRSLEIPLGICTNKPTGPAKDICEALEISEFFQVIIGSQQDQPKKPDPRPLQLCLDALAVGPAQCLYVGDSAIDYETAKNTGTDFRLFNGGYLNHELPDLKPQDRFDIWSMDALLRG